MSSDTVRAAGGGAATRAAVLHRDPRRIGLEAVLLPPIGPHDVLVRTRVVGICRSDIELVDGRLDARMDIAYPLVFGHEWSGEVLETGALVQTLAPGDRVVGCNALGEDRWLGFTSDGAAAERFVVDARLVHRIPEAMSDACGALVEPFACVYQGIRTIGGADPSHVACILGAGTIGLCALLAVRALGAEALVVEPSAERRATALRLGADAAIDPMAEDLAAAAAARSLGRGPDLVIEASGAPGALASALELAPEHGRVLFLGLCPEPAISAPLALIQERRLRVAGSNGAPPEIWAPALRFLEQAGSDLSPLVTATFPLARVREAFEAARDVRANLKVQLAVAQ
jgi:2-desacetyl-2-hydroxyethyl bacteriochlorophyllide A dehydrogenase